MLVLYAYSPEGSRTADDSWCNAACSIAWSALVRVANDRKDGGEHCPRTAWSEVGRERRGTPQCLVLRCILGNVHAAMNVPLGSERFPSCQGSTPMLSGSSIAWAQTNCTRVISKESQRLSGFNTKVCPDSTQNHAPI